MDSLPCWFPLGENNSAGATIHHKGEPWVAVYPGMRLAIGQAGLYNQLSVRKMLFCSLCLILVSMSYRKLEGKGEGP